MSSNLKETGRSVGHLMCPYLAWDHDITLLSIYTLGEVSSEKISLFFLKLSLRKYLPAPQRCAVFRFGSVWSEKPVTQSSNNVLWQATLPPPRLLLSNPSAWWNLINRDREELPVHHGGNLFFVPDRDISPWHLSLMKSNELLRGTSLTVYFRWY